MLSLFLKPVETITSADLQELIAERWPENYQVEYKESLSDKHGKPSSWLAGAKELEGHARDHLLKEIVAFANSVGGTLILGIKETQQKPACAESLVPLPRVNELARRFEDQALSIIDPPLPGLRIWPIILNETEEAGVIVFRVPQSFRAPHRLTTTGRSHVRNGASSKEMDMRQIQDMTLNLFRGNERIEKAFAERQESFAKWGQERQELSDEKQIAALRVTAVPLIPLPDPGRVAGNNGFFFFEPTCNIVFQQKEQPIGIRQSFVQQRPLLRGARFDDESKYNPVRFEMFQDGRISFFLGREPTRKTADTSAINYLFHADLIAGTAAVLRGVSKYRQAAGVLDAEFGLEYELMSFPGSARQSKGEYVGLESHPRYYGGIGEIGPGSLPIIFPRLPVRESEMFGQVIDQIDRDVYDFLGNKSDRPSLQASFPEKEGA